MLEQDRWVIVDTETTGLRQPIYPVEIAAQRMQGWQPIGAPFQVLINFDAPIEPGAERVHGYSRAYLKQHGLEPKAALAQFIAYADGAPLSAYNLVFDWDRVLAPTFKRMRMRSALQTAFCVLELTRNLVNAMPNYKLVTVVKSFGIAQSQQHRAGSDVELVIRLVADHIGPHLTQHGIQGLQSVADCAAGRVKAPPLAIPRCQGSVGTGLIS